MNFRLRQERNAFVFLVVVATPLVLLSAPLPYLSALAPAHKPLAHATFQPVNVEQAFARADRDRDGYIDASEAGAIPGLPALFALIDLNGDGKIDRRELAKMRLPRERPGETRT